MGDPLATFKLPLRHTEEPSTSDTVWDSAGWLALAGGYFGLISCIVILHGQTPFEVGSVSPLWVWASGLMATLGLGRVSKRFVHMAVPLSPIAVVLMVEALLILYNVPMGLMPTPSRVLTTLWNTKEVLLQDAKITLGGEAFVGLIAGTLSGTVFGLLVVRFRFLEKGMLPYASLLSSVPIVALAPVVVKTFGLEWTSKAIIVAITVFFPVLINVVRGLKQTNPLALDLMHSYAATPSEIFLKLRVPTALPFFFNALRLATTLALIGAIVGEFFGTTGQGLGFRIQIEAGRFNLDIVWAAIWITAVLGVCCDQAIQLLERRLTRRISSE